MSIYLITAVLSLGLSFGPRFRNYHLSNNLDWGRGASYIVQGEIVRRRAGPGPPAAHVGRLRGSESSGGFWTGAAAGRAGARNPQPISGEILKRETPRSLGSVLDTPKIHVLGKIQETCGWAQGVGVVAGSIKHSIIRTALRGKLKLNVETTKLRPNLENGRGRSLIDLRPFTKI
ncbi:hypothetical protein B0H16DRAFT_1477534 [Mycena metata]|uniref:Uncharacterized protein n=1 Tax=Mycena metata TaxID=1033252 RepID=A0AAD7MFQ3_9AGAR|nr:hypothetical protein B0H16DRAFT_1477534 [Mycena metata]